MLIKRGNRTNNDEQKAKNLYDKYKSAKKDFEYTARSTKQKYFNKLKGTLLNPEISSKKKFTLLNIVSPVASLDLVDFETSVFLR